jgi:hypothetical protein
MVTQQTSSEVEDMARIIQLSCSGRMSDITATHYARNLHRAGYGLKDKPVAEPPVPARLSPEWKELVERSEKLGEAVALWQNAKDAYVTKYPKDQQ